MKIDGGRIREILEGRYGVELKLEPRASKEGQKLVFWPADLAEIHAVHLEVLVGWRSVECRAECGTYARDLVAAMGRAGERQRDAFWAFLGAAAKCGGEVTLRVNDSVVEIPDGTIWESQWSRFELLVGRHPVIPDERTGQSGDAAVLPWITKAMGAVLSLMPLEEADENARREGAIKEVLAKRYERDPINRELALEIHGRKCRACGFDFGEAYGELGEGYIEVHHVDRVADHGGEEVVINPLTDLVPLCGNCHSVVHLRVPPYSVEEIKKALCSMRHEP